MTGGGLRIVLTSAYSWPEVRRGGERYLHDLATALAGAGHRVRIVSGAPVPGRGDVGGVPVRWLRRRPLAPRRFGDLAGEAGFGAAALLRLAPSRVDVWHATTTADGAAAAALQRLRPRLRTVFTDHGFPARASRARRPDAGLHRRLVAGIGAYVCVSRAAGDVLRRDFGREPVVVPPGVDVDTFRPSGPRAARPVLLYSGSLDEPRKNLPLLLAAAGLLRRREPSLEVWLLGPGDPSAALAAAPEGAAAVTRCGPVDTAELVRCYARAWVTVLPSVAESFGMAVTESFACGTPAVVRADGGGPAETVVPGTGVLAGPDAAALAAACAEALELARRPGTVDACRARAEEYDWRRAVVPRLEEVYAGGR